MSWIIDIHILNKAVGCWQKPRHDPNREGEPRSKGKEKTPSRPWMLKTTVESTTIQNQVDVKSYFLSKCLVNSLHDMQQAEQHVN